MKLIDKDILVAEIKNLENIYKKCPTHNSYEEDLKEGRLLGYKDVLYKINTLKTKEVDLEKEIQDHIKECLDVKFPTTDIELIKKDVAYTARRFFELGLRKGQKNIWHSMDETPNYPCDILLVTDVDNMFLFKYMENGRPVDRETPYFHNILNGKCWCYCNDVKVQKGEEYDRQSTENT